MNARLPILGSADMQRWRSAEFDLRPLEVTNLDRPQSVPEGDQNQCRVAMCITATTIPGRLNQFLDFGWREVGPTSEGQRLN
jgi:hypothetical protein